MIKAVTFDLWNTLFENKSYAHIRIELFKKFLEKKQVLKSHEEVVDAYYLTFSFSKEMLGKTNFRHNYVKDRIISMFNKLDMRVSDPEIVDLRERNEIIMLDDYPLLKKGSVELLQQLSEKYKIGLISDTGITPGSVIKKIFERYGILKYFQTTIFSDETGYYKPCYIMFEKALNDLKCQPQNSVHVGDLLETDIKGANNHQMYSIWLNEKMMPKINDVDPNFEIRDIREVKGVVESLDSPNKKNPKPPK